MSIRASPRTAPSLRCFVLHFYLHIQKDNFATHAALSASLLIRVHLQINESRAFESSMRRTIQLQAPQGRLVEAHSLGEMRGSMHVCYHGSLHDGAWQRTGREGRGLAGREHSMQHQRCSFSREIVETLAIMRESCKVSKTMNEPPPGATSAGEIWTQNHVPSIPRFSQNFCVFLC